MNQGSNRRSDDQVTNLSLSVALRIGLAASLIVACVLIVGPFVVTLVWAGILAVALSGLFENVVGIVGRRGLAATLLSVVSIALLIGPSYAIGGSLVGSIRSMQEFVAAGDLQAPPPPESIQDLPFVGPQVYEAWQLASDDIEEALERFEPQVRAAERWAIGFLRGVGGAVLQTLVSLIIAFVFLVYAEGATRTIRAVGTRISREHGVVHVGMAAATVHSVAQGVLGVAAFQAGLFWLLLYFVGFPGAGLLTIVALVTAVLQMPSLIFTLVPIVWGFSTMSALPAIGFLLVCVLVGIVDVPLKAVFLGRGLPIPTSVILIGAIGGMVSMGMMGLFVGAVVLGIGYRIFLIWLNE